MSGAALKLDYTLDDKKVAKRLRALLAAGEDLEPAFIDIGEGLLNSTHDRFTFMEDPEGNPWAGLFVDYQKRKKKNQDRILVLEGFLRDTLAYNTHAHGLELGTNLIYGATHQFGDEERNIEARPYLGISEDDEDMIYAALEDHFMDAMK